MIQGKWGLSSVLATAALLGLDPATTLAGNGTFDSGNFNYCVSVRFNANASQLDQIRTAIQSGSDVLADATDGQHRFGRVTIVNDSGASQSAEYWVNAGTGRAFATIARYGFRGEHINLFFGSDFQSSNGADGDAYTIAHEHVHHAYGVVDEYSGTAGNAECAAPPDTATLNFSLMDNYFTRGGRSGGGSTYTLNELCVASNHDPDGDNFQSSVNGKSSWETLAGQTRFPVTAPAGVPVDAPPASQAVTFVDGFGGLRAVLLLDRSGSMALNQRLEFAQLGANSFVDLLSIGDGIGVTSFATSPSVEFPLVTIGGPAERAGAQAAVNSLMANGSTNIGGGLLTALDQLQSQPNRSCNEIIVLLSDGDHNTGPAPASVIPTLRSAGVTVLSIGVGSGISTAGQAALQNVAMQTGGRFFRVASSADLTSTFIQLAAETMGSGILTRAPGNVNSGETTTRSVLLEPGIQKATFALTRDVAADVLALSLRTPSGDVLSADAPGAGVSVRQDSNSVIFEVIAPEPGVWSLIVSAGQVQNGSFDVIAFADNDGVQLNLSVEEANVAFPAPVQLSATPLFAGRPVLGAAIQGSATLPDGSSVPIELFDDGQGFDRIAQDGIYAGAFTRFSEDGTYTFDLTATVLAGTTFGGEDLFASAGAPSSAILTPNFVRVASTTAIVTGVPDFLTATVEYGPEVLNLKSNGRFVTAYVELGDDVSAASIDPATVRITAIDGVAIDPIPAEPKPTSVGDFDTDGVPDLMVKFSRSVLQNVLDPGEREIQLEAIAGGRLVIGRRFVSVISPGAGQQKPAQPKAGNPKPNGKGK